jgi:2-polyprenyl-3-methyl-5-hydroxy-6-metoxy-1,4-benzoquinol methylase
MEELPRPAHLLKTNQGRDICIFRNSNEPGVFNFKHGHFIKASLNERLLVHSATTMSENTAPADYSLETMSEAVHYNRWIYDLMRPCLGSRVLELGAGIGVMTSFFLLEGREVMAIDIDEQLIHRLRQRVAASPRLTVSCVSIQELASKNEYRQAFDTVVSSNVLEHIPDGTDREAVIAMSDLLRPGGFAVHWVPACQCIFGSLDRSFGHYRRYNRKMARALFGHAGFEIVSCQYWNMPGFVGWWLQSLNRDARALPRLSTLAYDRFVVPLIRVIEPWLWRPFGQSLLIVAQRQR